jgi:hypothetical protein
VPVVLLLLLVVLLLLLLVLLVLLVLIPTMSCRDGSLVVGKVVGMYDNEHVRWTQRRFVWGAWWTIPTMCGCMCGCKCGCITRNIYLGLRAVVFGAVCGRFLQCVGRNYVWMEVWMDVSDERWDLTGGTWDRGPQNIANCNWN